MAIFISENEVTRNLKAQNFHNVFKTSKAIDTGSIFWRCKSCIGEVTLISQSIWARFDLAVKTTLWTSRNLTPFPSPRTLSKVVLVKFEEFISQMKENRRKFIKQMQIVRTPKSALKEKLTRPKLGTVDSSSADTFPKLKILQFEIH